MKVISLNTWGGQVSGALEEYLMCEAETTDIFCFQEASSEFDVIRSRVLKHWQSLTTRCYDEHFAEEMIQTTCFTNQYDLVSAGTFFTKEKDKRLGLWTHLKKGEEEYWICNIHGTAIPTEKIDSPARLGQSRDIIEFLQNKKGKKIVLGDFNLNPDTESVKMFEGAGYTNLIRDHHIDTTRNEIAWAKWPNNKHLFADYTFVGPGVEVVDFQVPKNEISDHLPMELEIA